ncbi:sensor histidine kinase [Herbiconiux ginsengi]|uniref:histidine kinase n=1 Tax=Herbiconiux ginsengi TaxID=381665 RepID=A0A1H3QAL0_9MICO|nr:HAMP domain-containing sensor histidine kinase [Herbiconiux ginsengi]SDZ10436.1 Signal transduction histidine kinase [Herbiconiux ginsengi]
MTAARSVRRSRGRRPDDDLRGAALRLTAQFTGLVLILLAVVGGIVFAIVANSIAESSERALEAATQIDSPEDAPEGTYVTIVDGHTGGQVVTPPGMPAALLDTAAIQSVAAGGSDVRSERTVDGRSYLLLTTSSTADRNHDRVVQVAVDQHESAEELTRLVTALLIAAAVAAVLAFVAAYLMARRAIRPLAEALALQRRFVADASHELRTPLTLLSTRAQLLQRRGRSGLPADVTASVDEIVTDTRALTEILDDLLIAADPRSVAEPVTVDVAAVADEAVSLLRDDALARGIVLRRSGSTAPVLVAGSRAALLRLVIALATNALDHARGAVEVDVRATGALAVVRVDDDGTGFAPEIAANAFERFASGRATEPSSAGGIRHYGLGLAIVAEITRRHHGTVTIDRSAPGGAVVCSIPLQAPERGR